MSLSLKSMLSILILSSISLPLANAGAGSGGGGDMVTFPDGKVSIADPFLSLSGPQPGGLPPLRRLHPRLIYTVGQVVKILKGLDQGDSCPKDSKACNVFPTLDQFVNDPAT